MSRSSARVSSGSRSRASSLGAACASPSSSAQGSAPARPACSRAVSGGSGGRRWRVASPPSRRRSTPTPTSTCGRACRSASAAAATSFSRTARRRCVGSRKTSASRTSSACRRGSSPPRTLRSSSRDWCRTAFAGGSWCAEDGYFDRPQSVVEAFAAGLDIRIGEVASLDGARRGHGRRRGRGGNAAARPRAADLTRGPVPLLQRARRGAAARAARHLGRAAFRGEAARERPRSRE